MDRYMNFNYCIYRLEWRNKGILNLLVIVIFIRRFEINFLMYSICIIEFENF